MRKSDYTRDGRAKLLRSKWIIGTYSVLPLIPYAYVKSHHGKDTWLAIALVVGGGFWILGLILLCMVWLPSLEKAAEKNLLPLPNIFNLPTSEPPFSNSNPEFIFKRNLEIDFQNSNASGCLVFFLMGVAVILALISRWGLVFVPVLIALVITNVLRTRKWKRYMTIYNVPEAQELRFISSGIQIGAVWVIVDNHELIDMLLPNENLNALIKWDEISDWIVLPRQQIGRYTSLAPRYHVAIADKRIINISRDKFFGVEASILDYVRSHVSCPIKLRDDIYS